MKVMPPLPGLSPTFQNIKQSLFPLSTDDDYKGSPLSSDSERLDKEKTQMKTQKAPKNAIISAAAMEEDEKERNLNASMFCSFYKY